ncbi:hypothetical protein K435DRAFT_773247, partial [Dendrothele bispora CBS 962.96]
MQQQIQQHTQETQQQMQQRTQGTQQQFTQLQDQVARSEQVVSFLLTFLWPAFISPLCL